MSTNPITIGEDTSISEIVEKMEKRRIKRLPVMRDDKIVGIVTRVDLLHGLVGVMRDSKPSKAADWAIRDQILAEIDKETWAPLSQLTVNVRNGIVDLWGVIFEEHQRPALIALIQNVPGVKKVVDHVVELAPQTGYVLFDPDVNQTEAPSKLS